MEIKLFSKTKLLGTLIPEFNGESFLFGDWITGKFQKNESCAEFESLFKELLTVSNNPSKLDSLSKEFKSKDIHLEVLKKKVNFPNFILHINQNSFTLKILEDVNYLLDEA